MRDLGIIFEPLGKFDKHITSVAAKGNCMVGWILQMFKTHMKKVVPQEEYGCIIRMSVLKAE